MNFLWFSFNYFTPIFLMFILFLIPNNNKFINPLLINVLIIMLTFMILMIINLSLKTNWFSMLIFLIMIGGMMIIFLYINSFSSNEFSPINKMMIMDLKMKMIMLLLINLSFQTKLFNLPLINLNSKIIFNKFINNESLLLYIFNKNLSTILIIMIIYLFICLMVVSFLCSSKSFSLRKIN